MSKAISTRNREALPAPSELRRLCQSLALLDAVLASGWAARRYAFHARWGGNEAMASMRDGSGDEYVVSFTLAGAVMKGFAHASPMASYSLTHGTPWPGVLDGLPPVFASFLNEPAYSAQSATFCLWRETRDLAWSIGPIAFPPGSDPDGSESLLFMLDGNPATYQTWAQEYYEMRIDGNAVARIYRHEPLTNDLIALLDSKASLHSLADDLEEIGYPRAW